MNQCDCLSIGFAIRYIELGKFWGKDDRGNWIVSDTPHIFADLGLAKKEADRETAPTEMVNVMIAPVHQHDRAHRHECAHPIDKSIKCSYGYTQCMECGLFSFQFKT